VGYESQDLAALVSQIRSASENIARGDSALGSRVDGVEASLNDIMKRMGRPGGEGFDTDARASAIQLCKTRRELNQPRDSGNKELYTPGGDEIQDALLHRKAIDLLWRNGDPTQLPGELRKSLSAFSFGTNNFILAPEQTNRILSCIIYPTDIGGLFDSITTSSPSVKFLIDNPRMGLGNWACEAGCFNNSPQPDLAEGLGELEIKPESIRMIVCATRDLIEDASINIENWIMNKAADGMRGTINNTLLLGDGVGKPMGLLNPHSGIPICEVSAATPAGQPTWQDCVMLKWEIPVQWQAGASFLMNQRTFAYLMTMTDAVQRPIWASLPGGEPGYMLAGSPIHIVTQLPDIAPGSTPIAFGNWKRTYMIVWRKAVTMITDIYTASWCVLFKFEARVSGSICARTPQDSSASGE
jgi:HK97 family phage major capsid protein